MIGRNRLAGGKGAQSVSRRKMRQEFELDPLSSDLNPFGDSWRNRFGLVEDRRVATNEFIDVSHTFASPDGGDAELTNRES